MLTLESLVIKMATIANELGWRQKLYRWTLKVNCKAVASR
uniref:Uncharacterized protein n=1 Tax=Acinetobacter phage vB_Ab_1137_KEN_05 TaxID=3143020 RepID=A0AAU8KZC6_9VIRU